MSDESKGTKFSCMPMRAEARMHSVDPLLLPLVFPILFINSFITAFSSSMASMSPFGGIGESMGGNTIVNVAYDEQGNIASIHERKW